MDSLIIILMIGIPLLAQLYVTSNYNKFKSLNNDKSLSGFEVARKILDNNGLNDVYIVEIKGTLSDHYDPTRKTVRLSSLVYHDASIASMAIAAHECGHAIQDKEGYFFLRIRSLIFPIVNIGTRFSYIVLLIGFISESMNLIAIGILLVSLGLLFQLITLPTEINASKRALINLNECGYDGDVCKPMLYSAAMTYVAGVLSSALEVLRLILMFNNRRD